MNHKVFTKSINGSSYTTSPLPALVAHELVKPIVAVIAELPKLDDGDYSSIMQIIATYDHEGDYVARVLSATTKNDQILNSKTTINALITDIKEFYSVLAWVMEVNFKDFFQDANTGLGKFKSLLTDQTESKNA